MKKLLPILDVPAISKSLSSEEAAQHLIPPGFEGQFQVSVGTNGELDLAFTNAENSYERSVRIPEYLFNPEKHGAVFPRFLFQISTLLKDKIRPDYFGAQKAFILNQNQVLYAILHHRATRLANFTNQWIGLLTKDIARLRRFVDFNLPKSYNARKKVENTFVIVDAFAGDSNPSSPTYKRALPYSGADEYPLGELIDRSPNERVIAAVMADVRVHPGSESMLEEGGKIVAYPGNELYQSPGYYASDKDKSGKLSPFIVSPFPVKQNIPSRLKTHLLGDCFLAVNYEANPVYDRDYIKVDDVEVPKDKGLMGAVIVFDHIELDTGRFVFGEIEQTIDLAQRTIYKRETIHQQFNMVTCQVGSRAHNGTLVIGTDLEDKPVVVSGIIDAQVKTIIQDEVNQSAKIIVDCVIEAGNARITNAFGLKGFTKTKPDLGYITLPNGEVKKVQLITGMNAVKAKHNTIAAARAALAFKSGLYENGLPYLRSLNIREMNEAAEKMPRVEYTDQFGNKKMVWAGYVEYYVTELGAMYSEFKPQNFMFEVGKYLEMQTDKRLFNFIWGDCVDERSCNMALELHKILSDKKGYFAAVEKLPVYTPSELAKIFSKNDLVNASQSRWASDSKLFDEEFNKGFYIDMRQNTMPDSNGLRVAGPMIRIPSAKTFNAIKGQLPNGGFIYPKLIIVVSRIIGHLAVRDDRGMYNPGYVWNLSGKKSAYQAYMEECMGMLYSNEEKGMTLAQSFIKPQLMGINMKQVTDHLVPWDVVVVFDRNLYYEIQAHVASEQFENKHLGALALGDREILGIAIRNPALWKTQISKVRIWDEKKFSDYLTSVGVNPKKHLSGKYCRQSIVISTYQTLVQHSDNDGDLLPLFVPQGHGQDILKEFELEGVSYEEARWTYEYYLKEADNNGDIEGENKYKLYQMYTQLDNRNPKSYSQFLINAAIAKANIGSATSDIWALYAVIQMYQAMCKTKDTEQANVFEKYIAPWFKKSPAAPKSISAVMLNQISYVYTRLVEEYVINAIKHMEGGSSHFQMYYLSNMTAQENLKLVTEKLTKEFGLPPKAAHALTDIVEWAKQYGVLESIKSFIALYNKGNQPDYSKETIKDLFPLIAKFTFFGSLVNKLYELTDEYSKAEKGGFSYYAGMVINKLSENGIAEAEQEDDLSSYIW